MSRVDDPRNSIPTRPYTAACFAGLCHLLVQIVAGGSLGVFGILFYPLILGIYTSLTVAAAALVGLLLYVPTPRHLWQRGSKMAAAVFIIGGSLFAFGLWSAGDIPPLEPPIGDPDTHDPPKLGLTTYPGLLLAVFAVLYWPARVEKHPPQPDEIDPADHPEQGTLNMLSQPSAAFAL